METLMTGRYLPYWIIATLLVTASRTEATTDYTDVAVIVNVRSATSVAIGNHFRIARSIPAVNMVYVDADTTEEIDSTAFQLLRQQVESHLTTHSLESSINYLVTTKGVPLKVNRGNTFSTMSPSSSVESELMLILGPYSSAIGGAGKILSPYYYQCAPFRRSAYGIYLVTRLDGYTLDQIIGLIDRSCPHLNVSPTAKYVFDQDPDWNATIPGLNENLANAKATLQAKGKTVVLDSSIAYLTYRDSVVGYTSWGSNDHYADNYTTHAIPHNTWAAGAIAETYVSTSARTFMPQPVYGQSLVADLIEEGISGAKGYVYEPYSSAMAVVSVLFDRYTSGYNLAESFFMASRYCSWMDVIIGDPKTSVDGASGPLPIQLAHLEATALPGGNSVLLTWGTASETNNYGFFIQHRDSLSSTYIDLPEGFVPGNGTTLAPQEYSWVHQAVGAGIHFYRLRQVDLDGTEHFTDAVSATLNTVSGVQETVLPMQFMLEQNYPNPFNPTTTIRYHNPERGHVRLTVLTLLGQEIATIVDEVQEAGAHAVQFSAQEEFLKLSTGTYFYRIEFKGQVITRKMILLK